MNNTTPQTIFDLYHKKSYLWETQDKKTVIYFDNQTYAVQTLDDESKAVKAIEQLSLLSFMSSVAVYIGLFAFFSQITNNFSGDFYRDIFYPLRVPVTVVCMISFMLMLNFIKRMFLNYYLVRFFDVIDLGLVNLGFHEKRIRVVMMRSNFFVNLIIIVFLACIILYIAYAAIFQIDFSSQTSDIYEQINLILILSISFIATIWGCYIYLCALIRRTGNHKDRE